MLEYKEKMLFDDYGRILRECPHIVFQPPETQVPDDFDLFNYVA